MEVVIPICNISNVFPSDKSAAVYFDVALPDGSASFSTQKATVQQLQQVAMKAVKLSGTVRARKWQGQQRLEFLTLKIEVAP